MTTCHYLTVCTQEICTSEEDNQDHIQNRIRHRSFHSCRIRINLSGTQYETFESTLSRYPNTLLGNKNKRESFYDKVRKEYFFNRSHKLFDNILFFYQSNGVLRRPLHVSLALFESECRYFDLPDSCILSMKIKEGYITLSNFYMREPQNIYDSIRHAIEYTHCSKLAVFYSAVSAVMTLCSIILICIQSYPEYHYQHLSFSNPIFLCDIIFSMWFLLDIVLRVMVAPSVESLIKQPVIGLDFLGSFPYMVMIILRKTDINTFSFFRIFRTLQILRVLRVFTTPRKKELFLHVLYASIAELSLLLLCLLIVVIFGATIIYMIESTEAGSAFTSIPECSWWALQTVVMIGYGDMVPESVLGKFIATSVMVLGAITIALPVLAVASKFIDQYKSNCDANGDD